MSHRIGVDVGTSRTKAVRFDAAWRPVAEVARATEVVRTADGGREQDMEAVWDSVADVLAEVVATSNEDVELVAVTAQGDGCWLVDGDLRPTGPAILWNDNRAAALVGELLADGTFDAAFARTGSYGAAGLPHVLLRWLDEHQPSRVHDARHLLTCGGWVHSRLTGRAVAEHSDIANPFLPAGSVAYDDELLDVYGLTWARRLLPPVVTGGQRVAPLSADGAARVGLPTGTPVGYAPYDVVAAAIGSGCVRTGDGSAVLGTTLCVSAVADDPEPHRPPGGMTLPAPGGRSLLAYATLSGTEVLDWAARLLGLDGGQGADAVCTLAAESSRDDVPLFLPYLSPAGERSPFLDPGVTGGFRGLRLSQSPADLARGVLDGLCLAVRDCLEATGVDVGELALCGGGARNATFAQSVADVTGVAVRGPESPEVGALGAVLSTVVDTGAVATIEDAVAAGVRPGPRFAPEPAEQARLDSAYERFVAASTALREAPSPSDIKPSQPV